MLAKQGDCLGAEGTDDHSILSLELRETYGLDSKEQV